MARSSDSEDPKEIVRRGYDQVSLRYRRGSETPPAHAIWIGQLLERLGAAAEVLDLGCGCGVPVARDLAAAGHHVTGVDLSDVQIQRARKLVPDATFIKADAAAIEFGKSCFDAIVCLYTIIHLPLDSQAPLLGRIGRWLRPGGWLLLTAGEQSWTGSEEDWLGGGATMWWSHSDRPTYRRWLVEAGMQVVEESTMPEGEGAHSVFWARRS